MTSKPSNIPPTDQLPPIVCVGFPRWEGTDYLSSTVQLMSELASSGQRVLYVDYPFTYKDLWQHRPGVPTDELKGRAPALQSRELPTGGLVQLLRLPPFAPANFLRAEWTYDTLLKWNARRATKAIRRALFELNWNAPIVINAFNPALGNALAGKLNERLLVYYCYDEISAAPWIARHGTRHEQHFLKTADLTLVSSQGLYETKKHAAKSIKLVKNGVNLHLFRATGDRPGDVPEGPVIGYVGSVDDRLDYELLTAIARRFPETALVFVGRIMAEAAANKLAELPNVHLLGSRPPAQLGNYLMTFGVGLIPFVKNKLTAGIYPLKINEYLAMGLPVISTSFADLSDFASHLPETPDTDTFLTAVDKALCGQAPGNAASRISFAAANSWRARAGQIKEALQEVLITKKTVPQDA